MNPDSTQPTKHEANGQSGTNSTVFGVTTSLDGIITKKEGLFTSEVIGFRLLSGNHTVLIRLIISPAYQSMRFSEDVVSTRLLSAHVLSAYGVVDVTDSIGYEFDSPQCSYQGLPTMVTRLTSTAMANISNAAIRNQSRRVNLSYSPELAAVAACLLIPIFLFTGVGYDLLALAGAASVVGAYWLSRRRKQSILRDIAGAQPPNGTRNQSSNESDSQ